MKKKEEKLVELYILNIGVVQMDIVVQDVNNHFDQCSTETE